MYTKYEVDPTLQLGYLGVKKSLIIFKDNLSIWTLFHGISFTQPSNGRGFPENFENFRNVSNFEELYLRAQGIFFDGTGTIAKIYVETFQGT